MFPVLSCKPCVVAKQIDNGYSQCGRMYPSHIKLLVYHSDRHTGGESHLLSVTGRDLAAVSCRPADNGYSVLAVSVDLGCVMLDFVGYKSLGGPFPFQEARPPVAVSACLFFQSRLLSASFLSPPGPGYGPVRFAGFHGMLPLKAV